MHAALHAARHRQSGGWCCRLPDQTRAPVEMHSPQTTDEREASSSLFLHRISQFLASELASFMIMHVYVGCGLCGNNLLQFTRITIDNSLFSQKIFLKKFELSFFPWSVSDFAVARHAGCRAGAATACGCLSVSVCVCLSRACLLYAQGGRGSVLVTPRLCDCTRVYRMPIAKQGS